MPLCSFSFFCWLVARRGDAKILLSGSLRKEWGIPHFQNIPVKLFFVMHATARKKEPLWFPGAVVGRTEGEGREKDRWLWRETEDREAPTSAPWRRKEDRGLWGVPIVCDYSSFSTHSILLIKFVSFLLFPLPP